MATLSLVPEDVSLALYAGDGATIKITVTDNADPPAPINLTGAVTAQIRTAPNAAGAALADFTADLTQATSGIVLISLTGVQTAALIDASGGFTGVYDVQWTPAGSEPLTLVQGGVTCELDVTHG